MSHNRRRQDLAFYGRVAEYSEGAAREAINLSRKCRSKLVILSVVDANPELDALAPQISEKQERAARQNLDALLDHARKQGVEASTVVNRGEESYKYIVEEAVKNNSTLIVMGRRGRAGLKRLMMESVTARVIGHAPCNVLVVPWAAELGFRTIVVATDGSRYSTAASAEAIGLARRNGSALTVIAVVPAELATPTDIDFTMKEALYMESTKSLDAFKRIALENARNGILAQGVRDAEHDHSAGVALNGRSPSLLNLGRSFFKRKKQHKD
ncbi:MAG TPA: universal stress protein [Nitrospirota bacterium]|nr:universal stress protein [Nitrospirota bacterium]